LPTGDGICLVLLNIENPYDIHIQIALSLIEAVERNNASAGDEQRIFKIRVGINSNVDNLVTDVNGHRNIAGAGINLAQRVMSGADGNQILVGQPVFDTLSQREKYMRAFRPYVADVKHGLKLSVYQLVIDGSGLDTTTPKMFRTETREAEKLSETAAYYMAHAMVHRAEIVSALPRLGAPYCSVILLWMLAKDSYDAAHMNDYEPYSHRYARDAAEGFPGQLRSYEQLELDVSRELASFIAQDGLGLAADLFENGGAVLINGALIVKPEGQRKLKEEWPGIWEELQLEIHANLKS
jgi:hypothetical protein